MIGSIRRPSAQNPRISKKIRGFQLSPKARSDSRSQTDIRYYPILRRRRRHGSAAGNSPSLHENVRVYLKAVLFIQTDRIVIPVNRLDLDTVNIIFFKQLHRPIHKKLPAALSAMLFQDHNIINPAALGAYVNLAESDNAALLFRNGDAGGFIYQGFFKQLQSVFIRTARVFPLEIV